MLKQVTRDTVFLIDRLLDQKGWSRADQNALKETACHTAEALLHANPDDVEIRTIFDRYSSMTFQEMKEEEIEELKQDAKKHMGIDLDDVDIKSEDDLVEHVINRAYATNDLLTLLEAQLRLELIDPDHVSKISGKRLQQFNRLLSQQLEAATAELRSLQEAFRMDHDLPHGRAITPQSLRLVTQRRARELRAHIDQQKRLLHVLANKSATKRWLKEQRRFENNWNED